MHSLYRLGKLGGYYRVDFILMAFIPLRHGSTVKQGGREDLQLHYNPLQKLVGDKFGSCLDHFLEKEGMLTDEGKEILELGIDASISLHERMVNEKGKIFLDEKYDFLLSLSLENLEKNL